MELTAGIHRAARIQPDQTALVGSVRAGPGDLTGNFEVRWTWQQFQNRVARLAAVFQQHGVASGDRVAILADNCPAYVEVVFACLWAGAVVVPVNTRWAVPEVAACLDDCSPALVLADTLHWDLAARVGAPLALHDLDALMAAAEPVVDARRGGADLAALYYTGGTTGKAKGVMLSHDNLMANSLMALSALELNAGSVHLHTAPLFHVAGGARLFSVTLAGGTHVVLPRFEVDSFLATISRERVTVTVIVPTMLNRLVHHPDLSGHNLASLRLLCYGASPMPEAMLRAARKLLPEVRFLQSYGMTELSPVASILRPEHHQFEGPHQQRLRSAGQPVPTAEIAIHNDQGQDLGVGEVGEIVVRGPMVMQGYWQQPELTAETLRGGWMHTGDAGYLDSDGFLYLVDRVKDMIVTGGENVYSAEVENVLYGHPGVQECAVIGIPDATWGEAVHAVVLPSAIGVGTPQLEASLLAHCREQIAGYKCPKSVQLVAAELPRSGAGKILKADLRAPFWQGQARSVS